MHVRATDGARSLRFQRAHLKRVFEPLQGLELEVARDGSVAGTAITAIKWAFQTIRHCIRAAAFQIFEILLRLAIAIVGALRAALVASLVVSRPHRGRE